MSVVTGVLVVCLCEEKGKVSLVCGRSGGVMKVHVEGACGSEV